MTVTYRRRNALSFPTGALTKGDMSHENDKSQAEQGVRPTKDVLEKSIGPDWKDYRKMNEIWKRVDRTLGDSKLLIEKQVVHAIAECAFQQV